MALAFSSASDSRKRDVSAESFSGVKLPFGTPETNFSCLRKVESNIFFGGGVGRLRILFQGACQQQSAADTADS